MAGSKTKKVTPLMKQYNAIKVKYPSALLLFRVGDFYETFGEDAVKASKVLNIVLTKRANGAASEMELAGFPHHSLDTYLPKLVRAGLRVAICDQLENPKNVKGIVKRGVTELVTPGLSYSDHVLESKSNNYLAAIHFSKQSHGVSFLDLSTGEFFLAQGSAEYIDKLLQGLKPSEVVYSKAFRNKFEQDFGDQFNSYYLEDWLFAYDFAFEKLTQHFGTNNLKGFGVQDYQNGIVAAGAILHYLEATEHRKLNHIRAISRLEEDKYVWLDRFTIRNLELIAAQQDGGIPLIDIMDETSTPMGGRLLKKWMVLPLKDVGRIQERLNVVDKFFQHEDLLQSTVEKLRPIGDLERLISKVAVGRINPRELRQLLKALKQIQPIKELLGFNSFSLLNKMAEQLDVCTFLVEKIETELMDDPPMLVHKGNIIKEGVDEKLDEYRGLLYSGKDHLVKIQQRESERTGITSLKIAFNRVFGYYLEVSNAHKDKVPEEWIRKQTLVNAERYITDELKGYEEKILHAEEHMLGIELELFQDLIKTASDFVPQIQRNAQILAQLDCLSSFAVIAKSNNYAKPKVDDSYALDIKNGRHPVIEKQLPPGESYIPNDVYLDNESQQILVITGPNMAGKSALLRQCALISLMAQMGSFVPAESAHLGIVDKVFTRVGASDNLSKGESTFMVEMLETSSILNNLSNRSLILMDEIGRGTSTYDGVSIAWAIVEYLHKNSDCRAKTLFATHYHELNKLATDFERIKNFNVAVKEVDNQVIFLRKLKEGGSEHSFGIHVARMAGMPQQVVLRANEILGHLESDKVREKRDEKAESIPTSEVQMSMFASDPVWDKVRDLLRNTDTNSTTPVEALLKLHEMKNLLDKS